MRKHYSLFVLVQLLCFASIAQEADTIPEAEAEQALEFVFENYTQSIPGGDVAFDMVAIQGGQFTMGSPEDEPGRDEDEGPQHQVEVSSFWMMSQEVSWDIFRLYVLRQIDSLQPAWEGYPEVAMEVDGVSGATIPYVDVSFGMGLDGFPAVAMSQHSAATFCKWLSAMTGYFYRLPTEAEWEYACRAGTETAYSFGDTSAVDAHAWYVDNSNSAYGLVGSKEPNPWGLYDMHGNVMEWTMDFYVDSLYAGRGEVTENPFIEPKKTMPRVARGGSWKDPLDELRCANREFSKRKWKMSDPQVPKSKWWNTDAPFAGFRIVRPLETPPEEEWAKYWDE